MSRTVCTEGQMMGGSCRGLGGGCAFLSCRDDVGDNRRVLECVQGCDLVAAGWSRNRRMDASAFAASPCATVTMPALLLEARSHPQWLEARVQGHHPRSGPSLGEQ